MNKIEIRSDWTISSNGEDVFVLYMKRNKDDNDEEIFHAACQATSFDDLQIMKDFVETLLSELFYTAFPEMGDKSLKEMVNTIDQMATEA